MQKIASFLEKQERMCVGMSKKQRAGSFHDTLNKKVVIQFYSVVQIYYKIRSVVGKHLPFTESIKCLSYSTQEL